MQSKKELFCDLINRAKTLGLAEQDVAGAREYIGYNEYGVCFDLIITQLYEFNIGIDNQFYLTISQIAKELNIPSEAYSFIEELIRPPKLH